MDNSAFSSMLTISVLFGFLGGLCFYNLLSDFIDFVAKKINQIEEMRSKNKKGD